MPTGGVNYETGPKYREAISANGYTSVLGMSAPLKLVEHEQRPGDTETVRRSRPWRHLRRKWHLVWIVDRDLGVLSFDYTGLDKLGTGSPTEKLDVRGNILADSGVAESYINLSGGGKRVRVKDIRPILRGLTPIQIRF